MPIVQKRLQLQPVGRPGIDRSIAFCVGHVSAEERQRLRGVVMDAKDRIDVMEKFDELKQLAWEAISSGTTGEFLDALDRRTGNRFDPGPAFETFADEWKKTCVDNADLSETQRLQDKGVLSNHLKPFFGRYHLREIGPREVDRYKAAKRVQKHQYATGYKAHSLNNHLSVLHRIFEKAIEYGLAEQNPVTKRAWLRRDSTPEDQENWWRPDEEGKAFTCLKEKWRARDPLEYHAMLTQLLIGCRFSELRAFEKKDLDLTAPGIWIRRSIALTEVNTPKNKQARFAVIPKALADELMVWMLKTEGQLLFPSPRGKLLPNNTLNRWFAKLCEEAGVRRISSHGARHTSGSAYAYQGLSQKAIAQLLGHENTDATERYTHVQVRSMAPFVEERWARLSGAAK